MIELKEFVVMMNKMIEKRCGDTDLKEKFAKVDEDCDGQITAVELQKALESMGEQCTEEDVKKMIRCVDLDGDGQVNIEGT